MMTRVPYDPTSVRHTSPISSPLRHPLPSLSRLLNDNLRLHKRLTPPFGSYAHRPVSNHKIQIFVHGLIHAEVKFSTDG
jgi:hypothetical protein